MGPSHAVGTWEHQEEPALSPYRDGNHRHQLVQLELMDDLPPPPQTPKLPIHAPPTTRKKWITGFCVLFCFFRGRGQTLPVLLSPPPAQESFPRRENPWGKTPTAGLAAAQNRLLRGTNLPRARAGSARSRHTKHPCVSRLPPCPTPRLKKGEKRCSYLVMNNPEAAGGEDSTCKRKKSKSSW